MSATEAESATTDGILGTDDTGVARGSMVAVIGAMVLHLLTQVGSLSIEFGLLILLFILLPTYVIVAWLVDDLASVDNGALLVLAASAFVIVLIVGSQFDQTGFLGFPVDGPQIAMYELAIVLGASYAVASIE